jgi:hypothetical protein
MKLICMDFDGEFVREGPKFKNLDEAWIHSNNLGSTWYFYPFHFVVTDSYLTVVDAPSPWADMMKGRKVKTIQRLMKAHSENPEMENTNAETFWLTLDEEF